MSQKYDERIIEHLLLGNNPQDLAAMFYDRMTDEEKAEVLNYIKENPMTAWDRFMGLSPNERTRVAQVVLHEAERSPAEIVEETLKNQDPEGLDYYLNLIKEEDNGD